MMSVGPASWPLAMSVFFLSWALPLSRLCFRQPRQFQANAFWYLPLEPVLSKGQTMLL